jgi:hypothetical protein
MSETFTMALAILKCHGSRVAGYIKRQSKDVLTLDYMGLKFNVAAENVGKVDHFIKEFMFFNRQYRFDGGTEYDSLPVYKIVETISREFKNRVNGLIQPVPGRREFAKEYVLGADPGTGQAPSKPSYITGSMRLWHEAYRAMKDELVSCKLLPYKKFEKTGKGIFGMMSVQDTRPVFHGKSFKVIQNLRNKEYSFSTDEDEPTYINFVNVRVTITTSGFVQFTVLETIEQPYEFDSDRNVVVDRNQVITDLMERFPECNLVTLIDLSCSSCDDYNAETERENFRIPRANLSDSEPGEGGGKRTRSKKRGRKSMHRRKKSIRR